MPSPYPRWMNVALMAGLDGPPAYAGQDRFTLVTDAMLQARDADGWI